MDQLASFVSDIKPANDDDWVDRLNNYWTVLLIGGFALTLNLKEYVGKPIQCWVPAQYVGAWEDYAENLCFVENTYYVPFGSNIPEDREERENREIAYYQWVPLVLALEAILFALPHVVWRLLNWASGLNVNVVLSEATTASIEHESRTNAIECIASHIGDAISIQREFRERKDGGPALIFAMARGTYVSLLYLFVKVLYIVNVVGQLFVCVLQVNMFNEVAFIFLWFWFVFLAAVTIGNFLYWVPAMFAFSRRYFVRNLLVRLFKRSHQTSEVARLREFVNELSLDGVLILRLISVNAGDGLCADIVDELYLQWAEANQYLFKEVSSLQKSILCQKKEKEADGEATKRRETEEQKLAWEEAAEKGANRALRKRKIGADEPDFEP